MSTAVTVAVRCRPLSPKEIKESAKSIIRMSGQQTSIEDPTGKARPHSFSFDHSFWSFDPSEPSFVSQRDVFQALGTKILDHCFNGYNACLFAYGQTGSGKTYSMMGYGEDRGVVPQLCEALFTRSMAKADVEDGDWVFQATVSYLEIYNEKCRCLLSPQAKGDIFKVREHPATGPYVENLTKIVVHSYAEIERIMEEGNQMRTVASTAMNNTSSRSHAIFTITFNQKTTHHALKATSEMSSRINLVDLAGSERADRTGAVGDTLKEGSNINQSLTTLGKVIAALADGKSKHVPFRDSALTWLLKENLSGNSKTIMLAALSPAATNYDETLSTLRYADRAKQLRTSAVVNEDPSSKKIRELTAEIERLRQLVESQQQPLSASPGSPRADAVNEPNYEGLTAAEKMEIVKKLLKEESQSWEENERLTLQTQAERTQAFKRRGVGIEVNRGLPSLVNLNEDPIMSECLVYCLPVGTTQVGSEEAAGDTPAIVLGGKGINPLHGLIVVAQSSIADPDGAELQTVLTAVVTPIQDSIIRINGKLITEPTALTHGCRIIFGEYQVFRYCDPKAHADNRHTGGHDYHKAMEERFEAERAEWMKTNKLNEEVKVANSSFAAEAVRAPPKVEEAPRKVLDGNAAKQNLLATVAQLSGQKAARLPPKVMLKYKIVLLGHQEVGKTSLRKCFQSDPMFFKKLPEVQSTTGIEATAKSVSIGDESVDLVIQDFAGQESYHSHTLFLTNRTVFCLVWKASSVEQDYMSKGIEEREEQRMMEWISEVYAKNPHASLALIATHLDELRDQSQKGVEAVLGKVGSIAANFIAKISQQPDGTPDPEALPLIANFAVSCRNRIVSGHPPHEKLHGAKVSALLNILASRAVHCCKADPVFWGGAIPGRHLKLIQEIEEMSKAGETKLLISLSEYANVAVRVGIESDKELLEVSQLMHSWNVLYMFNQHSISENAFFFLHPTWLCELAGVLFSFAHVINTPLHLRNVIGGLAYGVTAAENADQNLISTGYLRLPLAKVLFRQSLSRFLKRDPDDNDFETVLKVLNALELIYPVTFPCTEVDIIQQETPASQAVRGKQNVTRYFVPSLSPYKVPVELRKAAPYIFSRGVHIRFEFNMLPNELWWRLQFRLSKHSVRVAFQSPRFADEDLLLTLREAGECHNQWLDGLWIGNSCSRLLIMRHETFIYLYSAEIAKADSPNETCEALLKDVEIELAALLREYQGCRRTLSVQCPVQECHGWLNIGELPDDGDTRCPSCQHEFHSRFVVVSGTSDFGPKAFPEALQKDVVADLEKAVDANMLSNFFDFLGIRTQRSHVDSAVDVDSFAVDFMTALDRVVRYFMLKSETAALLNS